MYRIVTSDGKHIGNGHAVILVSLIDWGRMLGVTVCTGRDGEVVIGGQTMPFHAIQVAGELYANVRDLAAISGLAVVQDDVERVVVVGTALKPGRLKIERRQQERRKGEA